MSLQEQLIKERIPQHVAIIMDGNGRWAKQQNKNRVAGHKKGADTVRMIIETAARLEIKHLTLYAFSTENWNRPKLEVEALMALLISSIDKELNTLDKNNIKVNVIGDMDSLPSNVQKKLRTAIERTQRNSGLQVNFALSYSGRWDITSAIQNIVKDSQKQAIDPTSINEDFIQKYLSTHDIPDPELLIRTSGEYRISNFLLWQLAYTEMHFSHKYWPEFTKEDFFDALLKYQQRERRFGKTSEQL